MKDEEAQRLLGNGSNNFAAANDITNDSKKTTKKKGYSVVRLSMAFGTFAFLLLGVVFFADRGGKINNNIVKNIIRSGKEKLHYCVQGVMKECIEGECPDDYPDIKRGICETTGSYNDVLPYLDHRKIIPGKIYYGLDFTDDIYAGYTYTPHNASNPDPKYVDYIDYLPSCEWGNGKIVGSCVKNRDGRLKRCPSPARQIVQAWQRCAERCNDQPECHTFTVRTQSYRHGGHHHPFHCYFHKSYECKSNHAGIDNYKIHRNIQYSKDDDLGVWGGICRTRSGRTKDYACTNTPHP